MWYFNTDNALRIHAKILEISTGRSGVMDINNIESPLHHIKNDNYYPNFEDKLTHLVFCINKFHAFTDGNKRTSIALGTFFIIINGLEELANKFVIEMENIAVAVADNLIDKETLHEIITSILNEEDYCESLKLKIVDSLQMVIPDPNRGDLTFGPKYYLDVL
jgi:death-on-curing protein